MILFILGHFIVEDMPTFNELPSEEHDNNRVATS